MTPTIHTFDELKAYAEAKFPNAFSRLPSPESFHIQVRQGCTCFKIGEILGDPQDGPVSLHFRRNGVCKHDPLGDEKHILDTPFRQMESPEAKVIPKRMDAFVRYCMLARGHRACLHPPTYDFEIVFRRMCLHGMWKGEDAVKAATQSRAGEGADEEMVDDAAITGRGNLPGNYDTPASIQKPAELLQARARGAVVGILEDGEPLNKHLSQEVPNFSHEEDVLCSLRSLFEPQSPSVNTAAVVFSQTSNPQTRCRQRKSPYGAASKITGGLREKPEAVVRDGEAKVDFEEDEIEE